MLKPITFQTVNAVDLTALSGVEIAVWNTDYSTFIGGGQTDASGELALGLETGDYRVFLLKDGFTFYPLPKALGVDADPLDIECKGTPNTEAELPYGYTYLYGTLQNLSLNPVHVPVYIHLATTPQVAKSGAILERSTLTVYPDEVGYWGVLLAGGTRVTVTIPSCKFQRTGVLLFNGSMPIADLGLYG